MTVFVQKRTGLHRQHGAAILLAMLIVTLVATLSATALWQQWRGVEVETAERERLQSAWILQGALDWARLILREDARAGSTDHLAEPWAVPLKEARLSTFLASTQGATDTTEPMQNVFLSGGITDLQSRLNVVNLVQGGQPQAASVQAFARLFNALGLPEAELLGLVDQLQQAQLALVAQQPPPGDIKKTTGATSVTPSTHSGQTAPLLPATFSQLAWLGLSPHTLSLLQPYVTVLPQHTLVNINTASALVLHASVPSLSLADAQKLVTARAQSHFRTLSDATKVLNNPDQVLNESMHSVNSSYFEVQAALRVGQRQVFERAVVQRDGLQVNTLERMRFAGSASVQ
jgi:general secretion pathway protein K